MKRFEERLRELRESKGLTQIQLSNNLNLSNSIIATYELGKKEPSLYHLILIADYFNVSMDYLVGRDEEIYGEKIYKPLEKLLENYNFSIDGTPATKEEIIDAITFIKAKRLIQNEKGYVKFGN